QLCGKLSDIGFFKWADMVASPLSIDAEPPHLENRLHFEGELDEILPPGGELWPLPPLTRGRHLSPSGLIADTHGVVSGIIPATGREALRHTPMARRSHRRGPKPVPRP